jgi:hypothetical protein
MINRRLKPHRRPCAHFGREANPVGVPRGEKSLLPRLLTTDIRGDSVTSATRIRFSVHTRPIVISTAKRRIERRSHPQNRRPPSRPLDPSREPMRARKTADWTMAAERKTTRPPRRPATGRRNLTRRPVGRLSSRLTAPFAFPTPRSRCWKPGSASNWMRCLGVLTHQEAVPPCPMRGRILQYGSGDDARWAA